MRWGVFKKLRLKPVSVPVVRRAQQELEDKMSGTQTMTATGGSGWLLPYVWAGAVARPVKTPQAGGRLAKPDMPQVTLESIGEGVITADRFGLVTWLNREAERLTGWPCAEARGRKLGDVLRLIDQETRVPVQNGQSALLVARDGREYCIEDKAAPIKAGDGEVLGMVVVFRDVTEARHLAREMSHRASHDALTGLINRGEFEARLKRVLAASAQDDSKHCVLMLDLDRFKLVNDAVGHAAGDALLRQLARIFEQAVRVCDSVARLGGDEFGILLERCPLAQAERIAESICTELESFRFSYEGRRFRVGTSIGLVTVDGTWEASESVLRAADSAAYAAKLAGGNRVQIWAESEVSQATKAREMGWAARLEQALKGDGFTLLAQKFVPLSGEDGMVCAELLLRLPGVEGELFLPGQFMPAAERFNMAARIDGVVLREALLVLAGADMRLGLNVSAQTMADRGFLDLLVAGLEALPPSRRGRLCLELPECAVMGNLSTAKRFVEAARAAGAVVAIDGFGAGAASFGYLKRLAVDMIKIDGQFTKGLARDLFDEAAVRCFADVA